MRTVRSSVAGWALAIALGCDGSAPPADAGHDAGIEPTPIERLARASEGPSEVRAEDDTAFSVRGRYATRDTSPEAARDFLVEHGAVFGIDGPADLALREVREDALARVVIFDRRHADRPVLGAEVRVGFAPDGALVYVGGRLPARLDEVPASPALDEPAALAAALAAVGVEGLAGEGTPLLAVYDHRVLTGAPGPTTLAYRVLLRDAAAHRWSALVDARDGAVLSARRDRYAALDRVVEACTAAPGTESCVEPPNTLHDEGGPAVDPGYPLYDRAVRLHALLGETYAFFDDAFGRDSYDGRGGTLRARIVLRDSVLGGIYWDPYGRFLESQRESLETLDFVVHELTHGVVQEHTRVVRHADLSEHGEWLSSEGETGSLGESIADTFASFATGHWRIERVGGGVERDLARPARGHDTQYDEDGGSVVALYANSGIPSLAAYLLSEGGTNPHRTGEPAIRGIGVEKTRAVYERAVRLYLTLGTQFGDFRYQLLRACQDLLGQHGIETRDCGELLMAFAAIGVGGWDHDRDTWADECTTLRDCFEVDNCPPPTRDPAEAAASFNPGQEDSDSDRVGDLCEAAERDAGVPDAGDDGGADAGGITGPCPPVMPGDGGELALTRTIGPAPYTLATAQADSLQCRYSRGGEHSDFTLVWFHTDGPIESIACWAHTPVGEKRRCALGLQAVALTASDGDGFEDAAEQRFLATLLPIAEAAAIPCPPAAGDPTPCALGRIDCPDAFVDSAGFARRIAPYGGACLVEASPDVFDAACRYVDLACDDDVTYPPSLGPAASYTFALAWAVAPDAGSFACVEDRVERFGAAVWRSGTHRATVSLTPAAAADATAEAFALELRATQAAPRAASCP